MLGAQNFPALIRELLAELRQHRTRARDSRDPRWHAHAHELALRRLELPQEFLDWAKRDRHWSFTLAAVLADAPPQPSEIAARLLVTMLEQLEDEREITDVEGEPAADTMAVAGSA
jgi:hypothetical protein